MTLIQEVQRPTFARHSRTLDRCNGSGGKGNGGNDQLCRDHVLLPASKSLFRVAGNPEHSPVENFHFSHARHKDIRYPKRFDQFHKSASLNGAGGAHGMALASPVSELHSYSSAHAEQIVNPLPHSTPEPSRERAQSHGSMRRQRRQTCRAGRASSLIAGNWSSSRKKGKAQSWGQPAPSPALPNVRQSLGFPIRCNVTRSRAAPNLLYLMRPASNLAGGFGCRSFSGSKFFRAVERWRAPVRQQAAHQIFQDFTERFHRQFSNLPVGFGNEPSSGAKAWDSKSQSTRCQK